jgi:N-acetylmuramoyl-L-alanine amidase
MPLILWLLPLLLSAVQPLGAFSQHSSAIQTVVIDAGHGGHDPGALGQHTQEKHVNLAIALKLGSMIQRNMKDVRVIYTRDKDTFVELHRRAEIANENKADLFICIHCNASKNHALKGPETYVMGLHKSQANLNIAKLENASILLENDYQSTYNGFDPNADESYIIFSLYQNSNLDQSTDLAASIQSKLAESDEGGTRGVRQAGFIVLYKTTMPSVLVETGYLSNPDDEKYLMSEKGQDQIVAAIFKAFRGFRESIDRPAEASGKAVKPDSAPSRTDTGGAGKNTKPAVQPARPPEKTQAKTPAGLVFKVQVAAAVKELDRNDKRLAAFSKVDMYRHGGMFKYTIGGETTLDAAEKLLDNTRSKGTADAFIVIFRDGSRIPEEEAARILKK